MQVVECTLLYLANKLLGFRLLVGQRFQRPSGAPKRRYGPKLIWRVRPAIRTGERQLKSPPLPEQKTSHFLITPTSNFGTHPRSEISSRRVALRSLRKNEWRILRFLEVVVEKQYQCIDSRALYAPP